MRTSPEQEPVAWKDRTYGNLHHVDYGNSIPLYTSPKCEPLSDEDIRVIINQLPTEVDLETGIEFCRIIEKAHGIGE